MATFNKTAVSWGKVGVLRFAPLGSTIPDGYSGTYSSAWKTVGYTDAGHAFNSNLTVEDVDVAEEKVRIGTEITGEESSVEFAMAEATYRNLVAAFNGGVITTDVDGTSYEYQHTIPDELTGIMLAWDNARTEATSTRRRVWLDVVQTGSVSIEARKGSQKALIPVTYSLQVPSSVSYTWIDRGSGRWNPADA